MPRTRDQIIPELIGSKLAPDFSRCHLERILQSKIDGTRFAMPMQLDERVAGREEDRQGLREIDSQRIAATRAVRRRTIRAAE